MPNHLWVNTDRLTTGQRTIKDVNGSVSVIRVSPYSIPQSVIGNYDNKLAKFIIKFKYIDDEKAATEAHVFKGVEIQEGIHSHKILNILVTIDKPINLVDLHDRIVKSLQNRISGVKDSISPHGPDVLNQEVVEEILDDYTLAELTFC